MTDWDKGRAWYHGSPEKLSTIRKGSWVTPLRELAKAFSHKPTRISVSQSGDVAAVRHNGSLPGYLYVVSENLGPDDLACLPGTEQTHWEAQCDLQVHLAAELPVSDPPGLTDEEVGAMERKFPRDGFHSTSDQ